MPFYEYECESCKFYTEVMQKISDAPLTKCPSCGRKALRKLVSAPVFRLKGAGWYETDFKSDQESKRNLAGAEKEEAGKAEPAAKEGEAPKAEAKGEAAKADAKGEAAKADAKGAAKAAASGDAKAGSAREGSGRVAASRPKSAGRTAKAPARGSSSGGKSRVGGGRGRSRSAKASRKKRR